MGQILVLHGPNLNLLGVREPKHYGSKTLPQINNDLHTLAQQLDHRLTILQTNSESILIDRIQACLEDATDFIIFNPAAFTHTSIALRDALLAVNKPFVEVHLSNVFKREDFRHQSYFSDIAIGVMSGLGPEGYQLALRYADYYLTQNKESMPSWICEKLEN